MASTAQIYVADLAAYNAGHLHGRWIDLEAYSFDPDEVHGRIKQILARGTELYGAETASVHEEFAIHDYEGFGPIKIGEYDSIEKVCALAETLDALEANGEQVPFEIFLDKVESLNSFDSLDDAVEAFREAYRGEQSLEDYASEYVHDCIFPEVDHRIRETVETYFDYKAFARDMGYDGYTEVYDYGDYYLFGPR
ncbi:antirestriction protein ArdA [Mycobacteroides salmoniphilum]|uniref:antirestriction protein ArdA n=1 Tax=Mycobacteroides salmoniphilum TaxID=404941 RepID=UPI0009945935|nr:antirestriction protein ArdA [Mycobacteroides salmoniphilum]